MTDLKVTEADVLAGIKSGEPIATNGNQGSIHVCNVGDQRVIIKEATGWGLAGALRRWTLRREYNNYQRLQNVNGIPRCYGLIGGRYLVLQLIDGQTLRHATIEDRTVFFEQLLAIIASIHGHGVAHGDLMRKENTLVSHDQRPYLIDFGVSVVRKPGFHPINHFWHGFLQQLDLNAWVKHKYQRKLENMSPEDARLYRPTRLERMARAVKARWVKLKRSVVGSGKST